MAQATPLATLPTSSLVEIATTAERAKEYGRASKSAATSSTA
jgi:hypothetical protein